MGETCRILATVLQTISAGLLWATAHRATGAREALSLAAVHVLQIILADMQVLVDALEENGRAVRA